jgi:hypothetical protein
VFENGVLRISGPKRDEVTVGWRKLHNKELHNLYSPPSTSIIRMLKSRRMRWARNVARMRRGIHIEYWWESQMEIEHQEDQDAGRWIILKWILER